MVGRMEKKELLLQNQMQKVKNRNMFVNSSNMLIFFLKNMQKIWPGCVEIGEE
jgi:hypothetical protein